MARPIITAQRLRELLHYDPETGLFTWRVWRSRTATAGSIAGSADEDGYILICINRRKYRAHRLAWLYVHGEWPEHEIDHENVVPSDNRWLNLRPATQAQNQQNRLKAQSNNKCGLMGVSRHGNRYRSRISIDFDTKYLGSFPTPEEANSAYLEAKAKLHPFQTLVPT